MNFIDKIKKRGIDKKLSDYIIAERQKEDLFSTKFDGLFQNKDKKENMKVK